MAAERDRWKLTVQLRSTLYDSLGVNVF